MIIMEDLTILAMLVIFCNLFVRPTPVVANFGGETAGTVCS